MREDRHNLTPSEAHNHIKGFLGDNYHFENASRMQGFVRILASVNDRNKAWVRQHVVASVYLSLLHCFVELRERTGKHP